MPFKKGMVPWNKIHREPIPELPLPPREEVLWAAGFWEGEGSLDQRSVTASQVDKWPLRRLQITFGGTVALRHDKRASRRPCWQWFVSGERGRLFIELIYPHLSPRRRQQIDDKFITEEKRKRHRASLKPMFESLSALRQRDESGRYNHARIS